MGEPINIIRIEAARTLKKTKAKSVKCSCHTIIALCNEIEDLRRELDDYKTE